VFEQFSRSRDSTAARARLTRLSGRSAPEGRRPDGADGRADDFDRPDGVVPVDDWGDPGGWAADDFAGGWVSADDYAGARDGPEGRRPEGAGPRVERWLPGAGKHRAGRVRDVLRSGAASSRGRLVALVSVVVAVAAVAVAVTVVGRGPEPERAPPLPAAHHGGSAGPGGMQPGAGAAAGGGPPTLVVSVVGRVRNPGLVKVRAGARVADALRAAGGAKRGVDLSTVNLARKVTDGEQIHVGVPAAAAAPVDGGAAGAPAGKINLNTATAEQLEELPGIGEVTAGNILDWRAQNGGFTAVEQLREVDGIGERRLATLRDRVTV
jgi:competence protein ComEA